MFAQGFRTLYMAGLSWLGQQHQTSLPYAMIWENTDRIRRRLMWLNSHNKVRQKFFPKVDPKVLFVTQSHWFALFLDTFDPFREVSQMKSCGYGQKVY